MKIEKLPTKLQAEPLIDAVFEIRFKTSASATGVLPGILFKSLGGGVRIDQLPQSQIPAEFKALDPSFRYMPMTRLAWGEFVIGIGDAVMTVSSFPNYSGWSKFKPVILQVIGEAIGSGIITEIERYSMKYADLIPFGSEYSQGGFDLSMVVGGRDLNQEAAEIRVEFSDKPYTHIIHAITRGHAVLQSGERKQGSLIDVDTIAKELESSVPIEFVKKLPDYLDDMHLRNKRVFFECLTEETLHKLGAVYE